MVDHEHVQIVMVVILAEVMVLMTKVADEHVTYFRLGKILTGHAGLVECPMQTIE